MRYPKLGAVAAVAVVLLAAGCGSDGGSSSNGGESADGSGGTPVNVAYLSYAYTDFVKAEEEGLKEAVEGTGGSVRMFNANFDAQKLLKDCQDAVSSGRYNAILLAPVDAATGRPCVAEAAAADIPVVAIENVVGEDVNELQPQVEGVVGTVAFTPEANSDAILGILEKACADLNPCKVIGEIASPSDVLSATVVKRVKAEMPDVEIVQTFATGYDPALVAKAFPDALAANPDAHVFLSIADSQVLAVLPALEAAGKLGQIKLIGNGGSRLGAKAVADGTMFGTIGSWPAQNGRIAGDMLTKAVNGEEIEEPGVEAATVDEPKLLTKENIDQFEAEWGAERPAA